MSVSKLGIDGLDLTTVRLEMPGYVELVLSLVLVWGFGDALSTVFALASTGALHLEANPWIRALMAHDPLLMVLVKGVVALYAGVVLLQCRSVVEQVPAYRGWFLGVILVGVLVVLNNLAVGLTALV